MNQTAHVAQPATAVNAPSELDRLLARPFTPNDLMQGDHLNRIERIAERMAQGRMTVPEYLRGNVGDCMAIAMQAMLWNMDPFAVAQKTHIVSGRLGYEAQLVNAVVMASGAIRGSFHYEFQGDGAALQCRVGAVLRGQSEVTWGEWLASSTVTTKNSPLWKVNPKQQMGYLQVKNWARAYCPGAILGVYTTDELEEFAPPQQQRQQDAAPTGRPALPDYSDADFGRNLPAWAGLVETGKKTPGDLLATLSTRARFSEEQKARILSLRAAPQKADAPDDDFVRDMDAAAQEGGK